MASLLENLIDVLDKENAEYEKLVVLAEEKTPTIIKGDVEGLSRITEDEQVIVGRIQGMEKQRIKVLADVANVVNRDIETHRPDSDARKNARTAEEAEGHS